MLLPILSARIFIVFAKDPEIVKRTMETIKDCERHVAEYAVPPLSDFLLSDSDANLFEKAGWLLQLAFVAIFQRSAQSHMQI